MNDFKLGDEVRDVVSGLRGIAVCHTQWLHGCERITIQPPIDKDGKVPDSYTVDKPQIRLVTRQEDVGKTAAKPTGGDPAFEPKQR